MKYLSQSPKIIALLLILWVGVFGVIRIYISKFTEMTGENFLDLGDYNATTINSVITAYGASGIQFYKQIQILDFIAPLLLGIGLYGLCLRLFFIAKNKFHFLAYFPLTLILFDLTENSIIRYILYKYPTIVSHNLANNLLIITKLKFISYGFSILMAMGLAMYWVYQKLQKRQYP